MEPLTNDCDEKQVLVKLLNTLVKGIYRNDRCSIS